MKRIFAILLLFCLVAPFGGAYLGFRFEKTNIRKKVKRQIIAGIRKDKLIVFKFLTNDTADILRWEHEKEFEFNDKMYDIVERLYDNDSVTYRCWCDTDETQLNEQYKTLVAQALGTIPPKPASSKHLIDYLKTLYYSETNTDNENNHFPTSDTLNSYCALFKSLYIIIPPGPPPKLS
ncbi:MAG: hypothetical protein Q7U54_07630 [Bacteroidales bacterium]|nr:hypothetical protein [Bacteroidales bacterium]